MAQTKLTPARHKTIIDTITAGNYFDTACAAAGIHRQTGYNWLERGATERERVEAGMTDAQRAEQDAPPAATERRFLDFFDAVERARVAGEVRHVANIERIAMGGTIIEEEDVLDPETGKVIGHKRKYHLGDWRASGFYLERAHTRRWGRRQTVEVAGPEGGPVQVDASEGARLAQRLHDFLANVRNDPRIIEGQVTGRRDQLVGGPPAIESDRSSDDAG